MNIVIVGHVCIDSNTTERASFTAAGSPAMFMEKVFRRIAGFHTTIVAPYGRDFLPYIRHIPFVPSAPLPLDTMVYENVMEDGRRTQKCRNFFTALPPVPDRELLQAVSAADVICLAPLAPNYGESYVRGLLSHKKAGASVALLPQGYFRSFAANGTVLVREFGEASWLLPLVDVVFVSDQDHTRMDSLARDWARHYRTVVIMTQAEHGAMIYDIAGATPVPTDPVPRDEIVSSVGAGDIFSAAFISDYVTSRDPVHAARVGNAVARQCLYHTPDTLQFTIPVVL